MEIESLISALGDPSKRTRLGTIRILVEEAERDPRIKDRLERALCDPDPGKRWGAAYALSRISSSVSSTLPVILESLGSEDGDVRWAAAAILSTFGGNSEQVEPSLLGLLRDGSDQQKKMSCYCLRNLGRSCHETIQNLVALLESGTTGVRLAALSAFLQLTEKGVQETRFLTRLFSREMDPGFERALAFSLGLTAPTEESVSLLRVFSGSPDSSLKKAAETALSNLARRKATGGPSEGGPGHV